MPLWNVSTSTLSLDAMSTKPCMRCETGSPCSLEIEYSRALCLGADQKACGLWEQDCKYM